MIEVDLHLRGPTFMGQRINIKPHRITVIIDLFKERIEVIHRINPIGLLGFFSPPRATS